MKLPLCFLLSSLFVETYAFHYLNARRSVHRQNTFYNQYSNDRESTREPPIRKKRYDENEIDFGTVLRKCKYSNDYQPAVELAERALLLRPMPPSILTGVIKVFGEAGQLGRAVSLLRSMKEDMNVAPNEYHLDRKSVV